MSRRRPVTAAQVRQACAAHRTVREAAASLGIAPTYLSRLRRKLGLVDADRAAAIERRRLALELPTAIAGHALGLTPRQVLRLRQHAKARLQTAPQPEASPQP